MNLLKSPILAEQLEVLTVGFPFCGYKIITGFLFLHFNTYPPVTLLGGALIVLGTIDLVINSINFLGLLIRKRRIVNSCLAGIIAGRTRRSQDLGNSIDVLLSFSLVALVVGSGWIPALLPLELKIWNLCVVVNVLGAGLGRFLK